MVFIDRLLKDPQILNSIHIHPVGVELFHMDRMVDGETQQS